MIQVKNIYTNKIYYFRFFSINNNVFYYTPTTESIGFDCGRIKSFEPIDTNWRQIKKDNQ